MKQGFIPLVRKRHLPFSTCNPLKQVETMDLSQCHDRTVIQGYICCFCGQSIDPLPPDVASLVYTTCADQMSTKLQRSQEFYCHTKCFQERLHKIPIYVLDILGEGPDDDE
jgi:hypothetical protein